MLISSKIEIQTGRCRIGIRLLETPNRFLAVVGDVDMSVDARFLKRLPYQEDIGLAEETGARSAPTKGPQAAIDLNETDQWLRLRAVEAE
jgi:hypothetical protein